MRILSLMVRKVLQTLPSIERYVGRLETLIALVILFIVLSISSPLFLMPRNLFNIVLHSSVIGIISVGMTFVIMTAGIDLSVGSIVALSSVVSGIALKSGVPMPVGLFIGLSVGTIVGSLNGFIIAKGKIPAFIVTLGMMGIARGLALIVARGRSVYGFPSSILWLGQGYVGYVPIPAIIFLIIVAIGHFVLFHQRLGEYSLVIGDNPQAARVTGIKTTKIKIILYAVSGLLASLGGILYMSRMNAAEPTAGIGYELDAIAGVILGGTSLFGGKGTVLGSFIGVLLVGVLRNGLNIMAISPYYQQVVIGIVLVGAVLLDRLRGSEVRAETM